MSYVSTVDNLLLMERPVAAEYVGLLQQQPHLMAVDENVRTRKILYTVSKVLTVYGLIKNVGTILKKFLNMCHVVRRVTASRWE